MLPFSLLLYAFTSITQADLAPFYNDKAFEDAEYGPFPVQSFRSSSQLAPRPNILQSNPNPDRSLYTFFEPRGWKVDRPGPMILDADWNLVWTEAKWGNTYNTQVQSWKGKDYLTFWAGDDGIGGHGEGYMYMLDSSYRTVKVIGAKRGMMADQHGFTITEQGTLLYTVYQTVKADISAVSELGRTYVWDCLFQEVDLDTGKLLFEWRATDHVPFNDTYGPPQEASYWQPWDWFHINSVDKDELGNYLVSSRYTRSLHYVSSRDGSVLWTLGGKHSSFKDLSDGLATDFCFQHDARWRKNRTQITLFDNHSDNAHLELGITRGLTIGVDLQRMTAELVKFYINPSEITCLSQGAMQVLANGDVFIGYGYCGAMTEFAANGTVLSDVHFGPRQGYLAGNIQSYRARKHHWKGFPNTRPSAAVGDSSVFVSWNGATEVRSWELQHSSSGLWTHKEDWKALKSVDRAGFETELKLADHDVSKYIRVVALDEAGEPLGASRAIDWNFARTSLARNLYVFDVPSFLFFVLAMLVAAYALQRTTKYTIKRIAYSSTAADLHAWVRRRRQKDYRVLPQYGPDDDTSVKES